MIKNSTGMVKCTTKKLCLLYRNRCSCARYIKRLITWNMNLNSDLLNIFVNFLHRTMISIIFVSITISICEIEIPVVLQNCMIIMICGVSGAFRDFHLITDTLLCKMLFQMNLPACNQFSLKRFSHLTDCTKYFKCIAHFILCIRWTWQLYKKYNTSAALAYL